MGLNCCCKFLKFIVFIINISITLVGIAVVVLAALVFFNNGNEIDPSNNEFTMFFKICIVVIVMGSLLTIVGFIGCCGAAFENQCLLGTFVFLMIAALALDVAAAIVVDNNSKTIISQSDVVVKGIFSDLTVNKEKAELFQTFFSCCGADSPNDWARAKVPIPPSCCINENESCTISAVGKLSLGLFKEDCVTRLKNKMIIVTTNSPTVLAIVGVIEAFAMITSLGLCCSIRKAGY